MSAPQMKFRKAPSQQPKATLLNIAAELRIKILRNVLKSDSPLMSIGESNSYLTAEELMLDTQRRMDLDRQLEESGQSLRPLPDPPKPLFGESLSSQVLATCQMLYHEGHEILYGENTLSIYIDINSCHIFGQYVRHDHGSLLEIWEQASQIGHALVNCNSLDIFWRQFGLIHTLEETATRNSFPPKMFQHFRLVMDRTCVNRIAYSLIPACRVLGPLLHSKKVTWRMVNNGKIVSLTDPLLRACCFLGSSSMTIENTEAKIELEVTENDPLQDLFVKIMEELSGLLSKYPGIKRVSGDCEKLLDSVLRNSVEDFHATKRALFDQLEINDDAARFAAEKFESCMHQGRLKLINDIYIKQEGIVHAMNNYLGSAKHMDLVKKGKETKIRESEALYERRIREYETSREELRRTIKLWQTLDV